MKTPFQAEQEFIHSLESRFGADLQSWLNEIRKNGIRTRKHAVAWLKETQNFGHGHASMLAGIFANNGEPVYADDEILLEKQFEKKAQWKELYQAAIDKLTSQFDDLQIIPKKTYVSIVSGREFAALCIKSKEIRLGMDLGDLPFDDFLQPSKSLGAMPRISHMCLLREDRDLGGPLEQYLNIAYERIQKK